MCHTSSMNRWQYAYPVGVAFSPSQILSILVDKCAQFGNCASADGARAVSFIGLAQHSGAIAGFARANAKAV